MLLSKVRVRNYLSINGDCELPIDQNVTVLLGANDHGKSNLLRAIEHLNFDKPILVDDENWDSKGARIDFEFNLNTDERVSLLSYVEHLQDRYLDAVDAARGDLEATQLGSEVDDDASQPMTTPAPVTSAQTVTSGPATNAPKASASGVAKPRTGDEASETIFNEHKFLQGILGDGTSLVLSRDGVGSPLSLGGRALKDLPDHLYTTLEEMIPRVELFKAFSGELQDSVKADEIESDDSEFLQGIFFYAGLNPLDCESLFIQDDETDKTLEEASKRLDAELRQRWAQGVDLNLHFQLKHRNDSIELLVEDPAVQRRKARMSKRSSGVTQFFRLSMILHARRQKSPANSYIYVFDEPGVFLHPKGQKDLLAVFEQLAADTQIVYATHSLFMLNQNFPERHRLIAKSESSTVVDVKPYRANWKYAVDALGVRLTANILFSPNILLVEGDSDPIYIYDMFRVLNQANELDADANLLGIMSYGDLPNLRFLVQTFKSESSDRLLSVLFDGDTQGKAYLKDLTPLTKRFDLKNLSLESGSAIEDYCLHPDLFLRAVEQTLLGSCEAMEKKIPPDLKGAIDSSWKEFQGRKIKPAPATRKQTEVPVPKEPNPVPVEPTNAGAWFKALSISLIENGSSKVALARNYAFLSREHGSIKTADPKRLAAAKALASQIATALNLPSRKAKKEIEA
jgi:predicted ATPase